MFDLDQAISNWRTHMLVAGIKTPVPLDELESHLREEVERQMKSGLSEQKAFAISTQQIGQAGILKSEFAKAGGIIPERLKHIFVALAGVPNHQLVANMNTTKHSIIANIGLAFASMSGVLGAITFCFWPSPPVVLVLSIPVAALLGIFSGIQTRKTYPGKSAIVVGSINAAIWLAIGIAIQLITH